MFFSTATFQMPTIIWSFLHMWSNFHCYTKPTLYPYSILYHWTFTALCMFINTVLHEFSSVRCLLFLLLLLCRGQFSKQGNYTIHLFVKVTTKIENKSETQRSRKVIALKHGKWCIKDYTFTYIEVYCCGIMNIM